MTWTTIDEQMSVWSSRLVSEVKVSIEDSRKLATKISSDIRFLPTGAKAEIAATSPVRLSDRLQELQAFQGWMDIARQSEASPSIVRAQVITQNYICFVYLPESCFRILSKTTPAGSTARKCAQFLSNNPIRAFRNAIPHANWSYRHDFKGIVYWSKKDSSPEATLDRFEVDQETLAFWQSLSRCVAYSAFSNL
jgi:hypothetical protein